MIFAECEFPCANCQLSALNCIQCVGINRGSPPECECVEGTIEVGQDNCSSMKIWTIN